MIGDSYIIVGTAGHIDHGKTVLVKALTGADTDRLKEEKERGISIELGFAPIILPGGKKVGLVDVPGHEKFIRQMLAGTGGMDLVMLVIAADEGVMPQTKEHLDIIHLLRIKKGIVVLSKADLVDEDWIGMLKEEVKEVLKGTILEDAPIVPVSAYTGYGLETLVQSLEKLTKETPCRDTSKAFRLPVDRVFSMQGFGTIVTGTLWEGIISIGEDIEVLPSGELTKARNIQVHGYRCDRAFAGQRVAINLAKVKMGELKRGDVVVKPESFLVSNRLNVELCLLSSAKSLVHRQRLRFYLGTAEIMGRISLLDREELKPGETCYAQFVLEKSIAATTRDRFVVRTYSPMKTVAGGVVIGMAFKSYKRYNSQIIESLRVRLKGSPKDLILETLKDKKVYLLDELARNVALTKEAVLKILHENNTNLKLILLDVEGMKGVMGKEAFDILARKAEDMLRQYHARFPFRIGMPKEEMRSKLLPDQGSKVFNAFILELQEAGFVQKKDEFLSLALFIPKLPYRMEGFAAEVLKRYSDKKFHTPLWKEVTAEVGLKTDDAEELLRYLIEQGELIKVGNGIMFRKQAIMEAKGLLGKLISERGAVELSEIKDVLGSSRKFVVPLLEYFDKLHFTKRAGDKRVLFKIDNDYYF